MPVWEKKPLQLLVSPWGKLRYYYILTTYRQFLSSECKSVVKLIVNIFRPKSSFSIPAVALSKAWVCGRSPAAFVRSNPTRDMYVCLLWVLCVVRYGLITSPQGSCRLWCVVVCDRDLETTWIRKPWPTVGCCAKLKNNLLLCKILIWMRGSNSFY
jgi:hypothetical protein